MPRPSHREKILETGLRLVLEKGLAGASVRDIIQAAGVPQGSFHNHFVSKEAFGLEVLERYCAHSQAMASATLLNASLRPLDRLRAYIEANVQRIGRDGVRNGCMIGNFSIEAGEQSETIRVRIVEIFAGVERSVATCLRAAVESGDLSDHADCDELAGFIVASLQGAILKAKAEHSLVPIERFTHLLFATVLR